MAKGVFERGVPEPSRYFTSLMIASYFGLAAVVKHLLECGVDLNSIWAVSTILGCGKRFDVVVELLIKGIDRRLKGIRLPFRKGAQVDYVDRHGRTPLMYAVWNGNVTVVRRLLRAGARIDLEDDIGGTALSYAVCSGHNDVLKLLFKKGTEAGSEDHTRMVLLLSAAEKNDEYVVMLLFETGKIDLELKDGNGRTPLWREGVWQLYGFYLLKE